MKRILTAMSGGVDSSVAAALLVDQGYEVIGVSMQVWDYSQKDCEEGFGTCCSSTDVEDARRVCQVLNIPFYVINCEDKFKEKVIDPFIDSYKKGETPIACLNCNTYLKFHYLIQKMKELECEGLATGHYAKIIKSKTGFKIYQSEDGWKDQTYFLFTIQPSVLSYLMFPVGGMNKETVRQIAKDKQLPVFNKKDSTGLCFIGKQGYVKFIEDKGESLGRGELRLYPKGELLGKHSGIHQFTCGQRKRLGVSYKEPLYVISIDQLTKTVWLGPEAYLYKNQVQVNDLHFLDSVQHGEKIKVKIRFQHKAQPARLYFNKSDKDKSNKACWLEFDEPQRAVAPGQAAVFYKGSQLLGGGKISQSL